MSMRASGCGRDGHGHVRRKPLLAAGIYQVFALQLALSPSPRNPAEPIAVQSNQQLALKVEGVVQHGSKPGLFRKIQSVCLNVSSTLQSKSGQDYKVTQEAAGSRWAFSIVFRVKLIAGT